MCLSPNRVTLDKWWRNKQFWLIGGTSAHPAIVLQGLLKVIVGVDILFTLTSKSATLEDGDDEFVDIYVVIKVELSNDPSNYNHDGECYCHWCGSSKDFVQPLSTME
ncbi:putative 1,4-beta-D-xylan synthase [Lupinus albus]|uniref:Putative 1,4-beta-D-xylan synthase n=1 Tax=Lupinus albus TaxID=3870 RepID=A0A6A4NWR4_LUPAL|nr:putative 1,4-beta-D-xylan synthase [Lupinus albus]